MSGRRPLRKATLEVFAAQLIGATCALATALVMMRVLGARQYGVLAIVIGFASIVALMCDLGLTTAMSRYAAEHRDSRGALGSVVRDALGLKLVLSVVVAAAIVVFAGPISSALGAPDGTWPLRVMAVAAGVQSIFAGSIGTLNATGRTRTSLAIVFAENVVECAATVAAVLVIGTATAAAGGRLAGYATGALVSLLLMARALGLRRSRPHAASTGMLIRYAGTLALVEGAFFVFARIDSVLLGPIAGPAAAGQFDAVMRVGTVLQYPGLAVAVALAPRFAGQVRPVDRVLLGRVLGYLLLLQAALVIPVTLWLGAAARVGLGPGYAACGTIALAAFPYLLLGGLAPLLTMTANYAGQARRRVVVALAAVAINVIVDLALIPSLGAIGAAIGTDIAFLVYVAVHVRVCRAAVGLRGPKPSRACRYVAAIVLGAVVAWAATALPIAPAIAVSLMAMPIAAVALGALDLRVLRVGGGLRADVAGAP